jgi:trimethylamine:corrinoid methyltransferase-like protein
MSPEIAYLPDDSIDDAGAQSMEDRCAERTQTILADHRPEPLSDDLDKAISEIVVAARKSA